MLTHEKLENCLCCESCFSNFFSLLEKGRSKMWMNVWKQLDRSNQLELLQFHVSVFDITLLIYKRYTSFICAVCVYVQLNIITCKHFFYSDWFVKYFCMFYIRLYAYRKRRPIDLTNNAIWFSPVVMKKKNWKKVVMWWDECLCCKIHFWYSKWSHSDQTVMVYSHIQRILLLFNSMSVALYIYI